MAKIKTKPDNHHTKPKHLNRRAFERVYWPYIPIVLAITLLLGLGLSSGSLHTYVRHPGGRVLNYATAMSISGLLRDTNDQRQAAGVKRLTLNNMLNAAAQAKADDMAKKNYWSHYTPDGDAPWVFVNARHYNYQKLGENLATGFDNEQDTINGWMASPPHKENLLDSAFTEVGFGFANNPNYTAAGGGPMTIIVAFYGKPQVIAASTAADSVPSVPVTTGVSGDNQSTLPTTTDSRVKPSQPQVKSSRLNLVLGSRFTGGSVTALFLIGAIGLFLHLMRRHLRAFHRFLIRGEQYAIAHPLTDIGLLVIASLLFILSQTAGLIK